MALGFSSGIVTWQNARVPIALSVAGVHTLLLAVSDGGDGPSYDHADWGGARVTGCSGSAPTAACQLHHHPPVLPTLPNSRYAWCRWIAKSWSVKMGGGQHARWSPQARSLAHRMGPAQSCAHLAYPGTPIWVACIRWMASRYLPRQDGKPQRHHCCATSSTSVRMVSPGATPVSAGDPGGRHHLRRSSSSRPKQGALSASSLSRKLIAAPGPVSPNSTYWVPQRNWTLLCWGPGTLRKIGGLSLNDTSGNGFDGTLLGTTSWVPGKVGQALRIQRHR